MSAIHLFFQRAEQLYARGIARLPPPLNDLRVRFRLQAGVVIGLVVTFLVILIWFSNLLAPLNRLATDFLYHPVAPHSEIILIAIDKKSLDEIGTFPWSRALYADLLKRMAQAPPRVVAFNVPFAQPTQEDELFAAAIRENGNVLLVAAAPDGAGIALQGETLPAYSQLSLPPPPLAHAAKRLTHRVITPDADNITRQFATGLQFDNTVYPALGLAAVAEFFDENEIQFDLAARNVFVGTLRVPTDEFGSALINFTSPKTDFQTFSFVDVVRGQVPPDTFADKIVFIGGTSTIESELYAIPLQLGEARTYNVNLQADIANMLLSRPPRTLQGQAALAQVGLILGMALLAGFTIPHVRLLYGVALTLVYLVGLLLLAFDAFSRGFIIQVFYPALALALTALGIVTFRYFSEERRRQFLTSLFRRYVPAEIVGRVIDAIDRGELPLSGTRRMVTVLYADLRGFATISEETKPEIVLQTVNRYMELALQAISAQGGTVSKPMGDALVAIWNAPLDQADHRARGLAAAVHIRANILQFQKHNEEHETFSVGIGLATGWAIMGNMNALGKVEYTLVGDTVNVAARISAFANNNQILADTATVQQTPGEIFVRELSPVRVRGRKEPLPVWEVREASPLVLDEPEEQE